MRETYDNISPGVTTPIIPCLPPCTKPTMTHTTHINPSADDLLTTYLATLGICQLPIYTQ